MERYWASQNLKDKDFLGKYAISLLLEEELLLILEEDLGVAKLVVLQLLLVLQNLVQDPVAGRPAVNLLWLNDVDHMDLHSEQVSTL